MKKKVLRTIAVTAAVVFMIAMARCGSQLDKVVMTYVSLPLNVPSIVDKELGYYEKSFADLGLDFAYSELDSGADQTAALASGDIQILNAVGGTSVLLAAAGGSDIEILSMYSRAPEAFAMFSNDESIVSPEDLKGLTIAGPKGTNLHELLVAYLATKDMIIDDVNFVNMDIPSAVAALDGGSIDVALVGGTAAYDCENGGKHKITDGKGLISAAICTAASREFVKEHPEIVQAFLKTQDEISEYMKKHEEEAIQITADELDIEKDAVQDMYKLYDFSTEITAEDVESLKKTEKFLYDNGMIENHVDVEELFDEE